MPVIQGIRIAWGNPLVRQFATNLAFEALSPAVKSILESGAPANRHIIKNCGRVVYKKAARRYGNPDKSFVVIEQENEKDGYRFISVSRNFEEEFLQTWYPA